MDKITNCGMANVVNEAIEPIESDALEHKDAYKHDTVIREVYTSYSNELDSTIMFEDVYSPSGELLSTEIVGFYYGEPNKECNDRFYGSTIAMFDGAFAWGGLL